MSEDVDYDIMYEYFQQLTDESKLHFISLLKDSNVDEINDIINNNTFDDVMDIFDDIDDEYEDDGRDYTDDDDYAGDAELDKLTESIFNLEKKNEDKDGDELFIVFDTSYKIMHIYSDSLESINEYIYDNLFVKGVVFLDLKLEPQDSEVPVKKYYKCLEVLGQLYQDVCYN
jgi:hypothetical protein